MTEPYAKHEYKGFTICVEQDRDSESPDTWDSEGMFLVSFHDDLWIVRDDIKKVKDLEGLDQYEIFNVKLYDHSGISLALTESAEGQQYPFTDQWDVSSNCVFVLIGRNAQPWAETSQEAAQSIIDEWNTYLSGDVYGYEIRDSSGGVLESCWGIYGNDVALKEAKEMVDSLPKTREVKVVKLFCDSTWKADRATVPLYVGNDDTPQWLFNHRDDERIIRFYLEE